MCILHIRQVATSTFSCYQENAVFWALEKGGEKIFSLLLVGNITLAAIFVYMNLKFPCDYFVYEDATVSTH